MTKVSILDLTVRQVEAIEDEVGLPATRWDEAPSLARLYSAIVAAAEGRPRSDYADLTLKELSARVDLTGGPDRDQ